MLTPAGTNHYEPAWRSRHLTIRHFDILVGRRGCRLARISTHLVTTFPTHHHLYSLLRSPPPPTTHATAHRYYLCSTHLPAIACLHLYLRHMRPTSPPPPPPPALPNIPYLPAYHTLPRRCNRHALLQPRHAYTLTLCRPDATATARVCQQHMHTRRLYCAHAACLPRAHRHPSIRQHRRLAPPTLPAIHLTYAAQQPPDASPCHDAAYRSRYQHCIPPTAPVPCAILHLGSACRHDSLLPVNLVPHACRNARDMRQTICGPNNQRYLVTTFSIYTKRFLPYRSHLLHCLHTGSARTRLSSVPARTLPYTAERVVCRVAFRGRTSIHLF